MFLCQQGQGLPVNALLSEDLVWGRCLSGPEYGTALPTLWGRAGWCPQIRCKGPPMQSVGTCPVGGPALMVGGGVGQFSSPSPPPKRGVAVRRVLGGQELGA